ESGIPPYDTLDPVTARNLYDKACEAGRGEPPQPVEVKDFKISGPAGEIPLRYYRAVNQSNLPILVFYHGGGYTIGSLDSHDAVCRHLCVGAECIVVAVDYRMGPEHRFPAAADDAYAALCWVVENAKAIDGDVQRIAVGGDSAGGNLAAVTCLTARDAEGPEVIFQLLIYPGTDMTESFPSHKTYGEGYLLTSKLIHWFHGNYLAPDTDPCYWKASPLHATDHSGLPAAHVITAGFDPLQDEGIAYADKLRAAGVAVTHQLYAGMLHGFITQPKYIDVCQSALKDCAEKLKQGYASAAS
ncbi:MAG: alpha/beta hydrolase, partial [Pseudohongiellaceae bacterium]